MSANQIKLTLILTAVFLSACSAQSQRSASWIGPDRPNIESQPIVDACGETLEASTGLELASIRLMIEQGSPRSAVAYLEQYDKPYAEVFLLRGDALRQAGDLALADAEYQRLLQSCLAADGFRGLGLNQAARMQLPDALQTMQKARTLKPTDARIRNDLGFLYLLNQHPRLALNELRTALELNPAHEQAPYNLALAFILLGHTQEADRIARRYRLNQATLNELKASLVDQQLPRRTE